MKLTELIYKRLIRDPLFALTAGDAELAHDWVVSQLTRIQRHPTLLSLIRGICSVYDPILETKVCDIRFPNPLGLAAGFDKGCQLQRGAISALGWGFSEVGAVTLNAQDGNPRPRLFRSPKHLALCNSMGFNNRGLEAAVRALKTSQSGIPIGCNIGKGKATPAEGAPAEYAAIAQGVLPYVDFIVLNISSPNTPGLRDLQTGEWLSRILSEVEKVNHWLPEGSPRVKHRPVGVKISPDLLDEQLADIIGVCKTDPVDFIVAVNTTTRRDVCPGWNIASDGGISGQPLAARALDILITLRQSLGGYRKIISVGGIMNGDELFTRIRYGADLCEAYTGWIFKGPTFVRDCLTTLVSRLRAEGFTNVSQAVGTAL